MMGLYTSPDIQHAFSHSNSVFIIQSYYTYIWINGKTFVFLATKIDGVEGPWFSRGTGDSYLL